MSSCFLLGYLYNTTILLLSLAGLLLIGTSSYMWCVFPQYGTEIDLPTFSTVAIVIGGVTLISALAMLIVMCCKHRCLMYIIALFSALLFCFQLGASLWLFTQEKTGRIAGITLETYTEDPQYIDSIQESFECCGKSGPEDWTSTPWGSKSENAGTVPVSCCAATDAIDCKTGADGLFSEGCDAPLFHYMALFYNIVLIACLVIVVLQFSTIFLSCCVARALKDRNYETLDNED